MAPVIMILKMTVCRIVLEHGAVMLLWTNAVSAMVVVILITVAFVMMTRKMIVHMTVLACRVVMPLKTVLAFAEEHQL